MGMRKGSVQLTLTLQVGIRLLESGQARETTLGTTRFRRRSQELWRFHAVVIAEQTNCTAIGTVPTCLGEQAVRTVIEMVLADLGKQTVSMAFKTVWRRLRWRRRRALIAIGLVG